jgi:hypothetical protein
LVGLDGRPDSRVIVNILGHHIQHLGKTHQCDKRWIETLLLRCGRQLRKGQVAVLSQPTIHIQNLLRIGRRRRDLRQQGIGIQRHGRQ